jgi:hypothetical protein
MEFIREFFAKLSSSSLDSKQNRRMGMLPAALAIGVVGAPGHGGLRGEAENEEGGEGITRSCLPRSEDDGGSSSAWIRVGRQRSKVTATFRQPAADGKERSLSNSVSWGLQRGRLLRWPLHPVEWRGGGAPAGGGAPLGRRRKGEARDGGARAHRRLGHAAFIGHSAGMPKRAR